MPASGLETCPTARQGRNQTGVAVLVSAAKGKPQRTRRTRRRKTAERQGRNQTGWRRWSQRQKANHRGHGEHGEGKPQSGRAATKQGWRRWSQRQKANHRGHGEHGEGKPQSGRDATNATESERGPGLPDPFAASIRIDPKFVTLWSPSHRGDFYPTTTSGRPKTRWEGPLRGAGSRRRSGSGSGRSPETPGPRRRSAR